MFLVGTCSADLRYVCEVCTCDNVDQPKRVDCNGKQLITLTNLFFNETIEQLILTNNSLELKSGKITHIAYCRDSALVCQMKIYKSSTTLLR